MVSRPSKFHPNMIPGPVYTNSRHLHYSQHPLTVKIQRPVSLLWHSLQQSTSLALASHLVKYPCMMYVWTNGYFVWSCKTVPSAR